MRFASDDAAETGAATRTDPVATSCGQGEHACHAPGIYIYIYDMYIGIHIGV